MLQNKTRKEQHRRATSSALATVVARLWSLIVDDVAIVLALGSNCGTNGEELVQQGLHQTLHGVRSSIAGVGFHGLVQGGEVEAGVLEIEMAEVQVRAEEESKRA